MWLRWFTWLVVNNVAVWIYEWKNAVLHFIGTQPAQYESADDENKKGGWSTLRIYDSIFGDIF